MIRPKYAELIFFHWHEKIRNKKTKKSNCFCHSWMNWEHGNEKQDGWGVQCSWDAVKTVDARLSKQAAMSKPLILKIERHTRRIVLQRKTCVVLDSFSNSLYLNLQDMVAMSYSVLFIQKIEEKNINVTYHELHYIELLILFIHP